MYFFSFNYPTHTFWLTEWWSILTFAEEVRTTLELPRCLSFFVSFLCNQSYNWFRSFCVMFSSGALIRQAVNNNQMISFFYWDVGDGWCLVLAAHICAASFHSVEIKLRAFEKLVEKHTPLSYTIHWNVYLLNIMSRIKLVQCAHTTGMAMMMKGFILAKKMKKKIMKDAN